MFKTNSFEQELIEGMSKSLISNQIENKYSFDKIARAADYLNSAAEILDDTGMYAEAELVTRLLEKIAKSKNPKPKTKNDSKARVKAMKETGIPFLKSDMNKLDLDSEVVDFDEEDDDRYQEDPWSDIGSFTKDYEENAPSYEDIDLEFDLPTPGNLNPGYSTDSGDVSEDLYENYNTKRYQR